MGYRSDVVIAIDRKVITTHKVLAKKLPAILEKADVFNSIEDSEAIYYVLSSIKWYSTYPEIVECEEFLEGLDTDKYIFVRSGEDMGDIEERGHGYEFDVYTQTSITFPGGST